jgi:ABC-type spermidine/putrescine transport system permease subunit I
LLAAPFFTGVILRVTALQGLFGPIGLVNMALAVFGIGPVGVLMYTLFAAGPAVYLFIPFMVTAIYLSLLNFNIELLELAKINGARPWRAFVEITWPLNWIGTAIGLVLVFIPCLASAVTQRFLGGPQATSFGMSLGQQFGETGTWALGSAMGVFLFLASLVVILVVRRTIDLKRSGFTGGARRMSGARLRWAVIAMGGLLVGLYIFLYAPIFYVIYTSFAADIVWPFPPAFSASSS